MIPLLKILLIALPLCASPTTNTYGQGIPEIFGVKRTPDSRSCELPIIYFVSGTMQLESGYEQELRYLAYLMKKYKRMEVKLMPDVPPGPDDVASRLLLEERLSYMVAYMEQEFGIKRKRFIREEYKDISRGYEAPLPPPLPIEKRRVLCECVWD
ncbi:MAG: hypothetical protein NWR72_16525 [Bacteroidia bacterium]|nr:hypothetical protein [Bacteroidia bacterium]